VVVALAGFRVKAVVGARFVTMCHSTVSPLVGCRPPHKTAAQTRPTTAVALRRIGIISTDKSYVVKRPPAH
jgi:hypothetical protein